jgi:hypothetical protein
MVVWPPPVVSNTSCVCSQITLSVLDSYRAGGKTPFTGIYRVFHAYQHAEPHSVTLLQGEAFPHCVECGGFVRFELIFDAPYGMVHPLFKPRE